MRLPVFLVEIPRRIELYLWSVGLFMAVTLLWSHWPHLSKWMAALEP